MLFKRKKITTEFCERNFKKMEKSLYTDYKVGALDDYSSDWIILEEREDGRFCLMRGYCVSSYWLMDIKYVHQLKQVLKIYGIKIKLK